MGKLEVEISADQICTDLVTSAATESVQTKRRMRGKGAQHQRQTKREKRERNKSEENERIDYDC